MRVSRPFMLASFIALLGAPAMGQVYDATSELDSDRWQYPFNFTNGTRQNGPLFIVNATEQANFNARDGMAILKWTVGPPPEVQGPFVVTEATLRFWDRRQAGYMIGSISSSGYEQRIELHAARFDDPYAEETWLGTESYVGAAVGSASGDTLRNPYPIDLLTAEHVENNLDNATPWALGEPVGYTPGAMTDAFPIDFHLNTSDPAVQAELQDDLARGYSSWFISATFEIDTIDATLVPQLLFEEAVTNTGFGTSHQPPSLIIKVQEAPSSVAEWELYE